MDDDDDDDEFEMKIFRFELTHWFLAEILVPVCQPIEKFLGVALVPLLSDNLLYARRFILIDPQEGTFAEFVIRTNVGTFRHLRRRSQTRLAILRARSLSKLSRERRASRTVLRVAWFTRHLLAGRRNFFDSCTFWSCILYTKFWSLFKLRKLLTLSEIWMKQ